MNNIEYQKELLAYLSDYVTDHKKELFEEVLSQRTRHLTVVLEDLFKAHNGSAVMRTAEGMGLQDIHVVEQRNAYDYNPYVLRGAGKWLTLYKYKDTDQNMKVCFDHLKAEGYQIIATSPHEYAKDFRDYEITQKTAVVFGAEETGISDYVKAHADDFVKIPMHGFTESYNISVSAAIILEDFSRQLRSKIKGIGLTPEEIFTLKLEWYQKMVPNVDAHLRAFDKSYKTKLN
ncbi:RNA methyltransferase [Reichenbachiella carrageenanivorans]|uniref:tRNA (guanosine(18)-2'-O)-methyltransferase n=1 Tax=Reichenbachiella carrageenanivorans TaxID=2979869 RepID=A0ABY6D0J5_9BACT|nr:RNA methyltransferase [Reichenbachiella carrageenanivorans]UXX78588.1 RNA methyltransferase [Reichenbachiella carrageenanivorans]